ncbi:hypothetical protein LEN26_008912 [Aphanomyces euteiches]|nr:hypothetical protein AeMF1_019536 [Aphanomyces euteiches]KAH9130041.1 hypothetical protein LEN26_008912 [Aphanomyces euteiches]
MLQPSERVLAVLGSHELIAVIATFQDGVYHDMRAFRPLARHVSKRKPIKILDWRLVDCHDDPPRPSLLHDNDIRHLDEANKHLTPWFAAYGLSRLSRLLTCLPFMGEVVACDAAYSGDVERLHFLHGKYILASFTGVPLMDIAATFGHLEVVKFLHGQGHRGICTMYAMNNACGNGHLDVVKFLHAHRSEGCSSKAMDAAAAHGHLHMIQWLHANRHEGCTQWAMNLAAKGGHLNIVKFLHTHRDEGRPLEAIVYAARAGHVAIVAYLHEQLTVEYPVGAVCGAAECRNAAVVHYFLAEGNPRIFADALQWAKDNGKTQVFYYLQDAAAAARRDRMCVA